VDAGRRRARLQWPRMGGVDSATARTLSPAVHRVIFTSGGTPGDRGYGHMSARMDTLAREQASHVVHESAHESAHEADPEPGLGIPVSYWADHATATAWKQVAEHLIARVRGRTTCYADYAVRIATVERHYQMPRMQDCALAGPPTCDSRDTPRSGQQV
jgi:heme-degrading monooxygenase HmoA